MPKTSPDRSARWQAEFGSRLRSARKAQGLSQMTLANLAGIDPTYISAVEQGRRNVGLVNIHVLAEALSISPSVLFDTGLDGSVVLDD